MPIDGSATFQDFHDFPSVEVPIVTHLEYLAESLLLHLHRVSDSVHHAGFHFLRDLGIA
jgi:hypothetical protein